MNNGFLATLESRLLMMGGRAKAELVVALAKPVAGEQVLDIGSGAGLAARMFAAAEASVIAVDPSTNGLELGRKLSAKEGLAVDYREGVADELPVEDASIDLAVSISAYHHWGDVDGGCRELARVMRPGGRVLIAEYCLSPRRRKGHGLTRLQAGEAVELLEKHGFTNTEISTNTPGRRKMFVIQATYQVAEVLNPG